MANDSGKTGAALESCDIRVWCESCQRSEYKTEGEKYLCASCGKILSLDHEVHHEPFPHLSGDKDNLS
jgi:Zn finger protein HypA/HybF involved in hydrogenase expression